MKLIFAVVQDYDTDRVLRAVTAAGFRVTRVSSIGGFLGSSNATLLIGVEDHELRTCLSILHHNSGRRVHQMPSGEEAYWLEAGGLQIAHDVAGGSVVMVVPVERYERLMPACGQALDTTLPLDQTGTSTASRA